MLLGYKNQFVPKIESGIKCHTIRAKRKNPIKQGDTLHHYANVRQKSMRLISKNECTKVQEIEIRIKDGKIDVWVGQAHINGRTLEKLVLHDGFNSVEEFQAFWEKHPSSKTDKSGVTLSFEGDLIHWTDLWHEYNLPF